MNSEIETLQERIAQGGNWMAFRDEYKCKRGDWFFYGAAGAAILAVGVERVGVLPFWLIAIALIVGWYLNERERLSIKRKTHERRHA